MKQPTLVDAQAMKLKHPNTFSAPTIDELNALKPGDWVKVCAESERFWVKLTAVNEESIVGKVDNDLIFTHLHGIECDDFLVMDRKSVYDILPPQN